jgi:thymidylate synthase (FAD)
VRNCYVCYRANKGLGLKLSVEQKAALGKARRATATTRRPTVPRIEKILHKPFPVLDHGFVRIVDYMGDDAAIVQAARVSYGKGTKRTTDDRGLIRYLMRHRHSTPFEMAEIKLHVKLPIFVARQWIRHRTANVNELSARYSILDDEFYIPAAGVVAQQSTSSRQGRGAVLDADKARTVRQILQRESTRSYNNYLALLGFKRGHKHLGIARELARISLTLNAYTEWYWKIDLHNLFNFLELRTDAHAQFELCAYAKIISEIVKLWVPIAHEAFVDYRKNSIRLSQQASGAIRKMLGGKEVSQESSGLSAREWAELLSNFGLSAGQNRS